MKVVLSIHNFTIMKQIIIVTVFLLLALPMQGQRITAYATIGGIASQVEGDELKGFSHWGLHGGVGAAAFFDNNDRWILTIETDYSCRGIYNHKYGIDNLYNIDLDLHYVDIPVTFFFRDPYGGLQIGAGVVYSRLVAQPHGTIEYRPTYFLPDTNDMTFLKNDVAGAIEIRFSIWRNLQFSTRFQYSIIPIKKDWHFLFDGEQPWSNNCYNSSLTFRLLWQFGYEDKPLYHKKYRRRR